MRRCLHRLGTAGVAVLTAVTLVGCGGGGASAAPAELTTTPPAAPAEGVPWALRAVQLVDRLPVYDQPGGEQLLVELGPATDFGTPRVLGVVDPATPPDAAWVEVLVPVRPNDLTGWVEAAHVELQPVDFAVTIDVDARTLWVAERGEVFGVHTVAVGQVERPTPRGQFFITDKLDTGDPNGVWGPYAFGLSAYSDVLTDFIGGIGQVGLHGTNNPGSIGNAASSGCIRLPNDVITELIELLPLGTPVTIV